MTKADFIARETAYWNGATPIGYVFAFGAIMGLVVGAIIVYQILFADVSDHLNEYATLRAMGYRNRFVSGIVLQEAAILAVLGYVPGVAAASWLSGIAAQRHATAAAHHRRPRAGGLRARPSPCARFPACWRCARCASSILPRSSDERHAADRRREPQPLVRQGRAAPPGPLRRLDRPFRRARSSSSPARPAPARPRC